MSEYLFAYGTLQPGLAPGYMAGTVDQLKLVGEGFVRGVLYDLGDFPGAVLDPLSEQKVYGTVYRLPDDSDTLRLLDRYEDFEPDSKEESLFVRSLCVVELASGGMLECWIYVYHRNVEGARVLASGQFSKNGIAQKRVVESAS